MFRLYSLHFWFSCLLHILRWRMCPPSWCVLVNAETFDFFCWPNVAMVTWALHHLKELFYICLIELRVTLLWHYNLIMGDFNDCCSHVTLICLLVLLPGSLGRTSCLDTGGPTRVSSRTSAKCVRRSLPAATTCPNTSKSTVFHASVARCALSTDRNVWDKWAQASGRTHHRAVLIGWLFVSVVSGPWKRYFLTSTAKVLFILECGESEAVSKSQ